MTKYYVDEDGVYQGGFCGPIVDGEEQDHPDVNLDWEEVPSAPESSNQTWDGLDWLIPLVDTLRQRLSDVSDLFDQKLSVGFTFDDPGGNPQVFESTDSGLRWLDRSALRARKSKDDTEGKTFKARCAGRVKVLLTDSELIDVAAGFFDWGTTLDDVMQDIKDDLYDIAEGAGTDDERRTALTAYDITVGW